MEWQIRVHPERRLVVIEVRGTVTKAEFQRLRGGLESTPAVSPSLDVLIDLRDADFAGVRSADIEDMAATSAPGSGRRAIVAGDATTFGVARMYAAHREIHNPEAGELRVFRRVEDALTWLSRPCEVERASGPLVG